MIHPKKHKRAKDPLVGQRIGHFQVLTRLADRKTGASNTRARVLCLCSCNRRLVVTRYYLVRKPNPIQHCGCQNPAVTTHKFAVEYSAWKHMILRCTKTTHVSYHHYGKRGIKVCDRWMDPEKGFLNFFEDMGARPSKNHSLDRINPNGNYEPSNVRWATLSVQARNKRGSKFVIHPTTGQRIQAADLADELKMPYWKLRKQFMDEGKW